MLQTTENQLTPYQIGCQYRQALYDILEPYQSKDKNICLDPKDIREAMITDNDYLFEYSICSYNNKPHMQKRLIDIDLYDIRTSPKLAMNVKTSSNISDLDIFTTYELPPLTQFKQIWNEIIPKYINEHMTTNTKPLLNNYFTEID